MKCDRIRIFGMIHYGNDSTNCESFFSCAAAPADTRTTEQFKSSKFSVANVSACGTSPVVTRVQGNHVVQSCGVACQRPIKARERKPKHIQCDRTRYVTMRAPFVVCSKREQVWFISFQFLSLAPRSTCTLEMPSNNPSA